MGRPSSAWEAIERAPSGALIAALLAVQLVVHLPDLARPAYGAHLWRQTQTLAVARNFAEESMNPLYPRVDSGGASSGITGMEFPFVNYAIAIAYKLGGGRDVTARLVMLGFSFVTITGCFVLAGELLGSTIAGAAAGLILIFSPMFFFYSTAAIPDFPMLGFLCLGLTGLLVWLRTGAPRPLVCGLAALTLAALIKVSASAWWFAALLLLVRGTRAHARERLLTVGLALLGVATVGAWYVYARYLSRAFHNHYFRLEPLFPYPLGPVPGALKLIFLQRMPELYISYPEFALFVIGVVALRGLRGGVLLPMLAAYALGIALFLVAFLPAIKIHDYYMIAGLPPLILLGALGFETLRVRAASSRAAACALIALCGALPVVGPYRALAERRAAPYRPELLTVESEIDRVAPDRAARIVAVSDDSPNIYLWFMHRKGWSMPDTVEAGTLERAIRGGARYLVSESPAFEARPDVAPWLEPLSRHGAFRIYALRRP